MNDKKVWFITGTSSGFGRELAEEALEQGHRVAATARKPEAVRELVEKYPERATAVKLDVTNLDDVKNSVREALEAFGRIDVLVNNAGYGLVGAVEEPSDTQIRQQFETNVFGVLNVMREVLPVMREQKSGHILNVSSRIGFFAVPSYGYYSATKFAVEAFSEALAEEAAHYGVKVTIIEPGAFRTNFNGHSVVLPENRLQDVYATTARVLGYLNQMDGKQPGDPRKAAQAMIKITEVENPPMRLPLGEDAVTKIEEELEKVKQDIAPWRELGINTTI